MARFPKMIKTSPLEIFEIGEDNYLYSRDSAVDYGSTIFESKFLSKELENGKYTEKLKPHLSCIIDLIDSFEYPEDGKGIWQSSLDVIAKEIDSYKLFLSEFKDLSSFPETCKILKDLISLEKDIKNRAKILNNETKTVDGFPIEVGQKYFIRPVKLKGKKIQIKSCIISALNKTSKTAFVKTKPTSKTYDDYISFDKLFKEQESIKEIIKQECYEHIASLNNEITEIQEIIKQVS